jgi:N-(5-amino-5-carboxypentanoyl)-L-cysteinyl-D-valine synthase
MIISVPQNLPVTINGKIDTKRLLETTVDQRRNENTAPRNCLEAQMCRVWNKLLNTDCGVEDDFFKVGGDSILSLQLSSQVKACLGMVLTAKDIFEYRTIKRIVESVLTQQTSGSRIQVFQAEHGFPTGQVEMLPIQKWFFAKDLLNRSHWNQSFVICTQLLDIDRLERALDHLVSHHDAFRLRYLESDGTIIQQYSRSMPPPIQAIDITSLDRPLHDVLTDVQASLDITNGPIARVCYLHGYADGMAKLLFVAHHLVMDTVSWRIIACDLQTLYDGRELGAKASSYRQWAKAVQGYLPSAEEKAFWEDEIRRGRDTKALSVQADGSTVSEKLQFSSTRTHALIRGCNRTFDARSQELLLVALGRALHDLTGNQAIPVTVEGHGREFIDPTVDVSQTVGWFTTMYPLIIEHDEDLGQSIHNVRQSLRSVPNQGIGYGSTYGYVMLQLPGVSFNFLGHLSQSRSAASAWQPEPAMNGDYGLCQSPIDGAANRAAIDVTAWVVDGQLHVEISSRLKRGETKDLLSRLEHALDKIIELSSHSPMEALAGGTSEKRTSPERSFIPYFEFTDTPRDGPVLFLLPPGEGGAESYFNNIVKEMPNTRLVVFNNYHLHGQDANNSFQCLARRYVAWMRECQTQGPFHITGWSFGGVLSLEICRQLVIAGEKIATLALIDSYFNVRKACSDIGFPNKINVLDPINYYYQPDSAVLRRMAKSIGHLVLFKAPLMNEMARNPNQVKLFDYYMRSKCNGLDTLVDYEDIQLVW